MRFEALREDIVRDAEVVRNNVADEIGFSHMRDVDQLDQYIRQVESEGSELKIQVEDTSRKVRQFEERLKDGLRGLQKLHDELTSQIGSQDITLQAQADEITRTTDQRVVLSS